MDGSLCASLSRADLACLLMKLGMSVSHRRFVLRELGRKMISDGSMARVEERRAEMLAAHAERSKRMSYRRRRRSNAGTSSGADSKAEDMNNETLGSQRSSPQGGSPKASPPNSPQGGGGVGPFSADANNPFIKRSDERILVWVSRKPAPFYNIIGSVEIARELTTLTDLREILKKTGTSSRAYLRKFVFVERDGEFIKPEAENGWLASDLLPVIVLREGTKEEEEAAKAKLISERKEMVRRRKAERDAERERIEAAANR